MMFSFIVKNLAEVRNYAVNYLDLLFFIVLL